VVEWDWRILCAAFRKVGIDSPAAIAQLDVEHYKALGVKNAKNCRKLFYLVQRIKMAINIRNRDGRGCCLGANNWFELRHLRQQR